MTNKELANAALDYTKVTTCYLKGFWCQYDSKQEYARVLQMYPDNAKYGNEKYCNTDVYAADCICWIKQLLGSGRVGRRLSYNEMSHNPVGDCTNKQFKAKLYDVIKTSTPPAGYGLATDSHAALSLGDGNWIDCNYNGSQNGIAVHSGGVPEYFAIGKIPGVEYDDKEAERKILQDFCNWMIDSYLNM